MAKKKTLTITGKIKKVEAVKGTDRIVIEDLNLPKDKFFVLKTCANKGEDVDIEVTPPATLFDE